MDTLTWTTVIFLCLEYSIASNVDCKNEARCRISRVHRMKAADCYDRQFKNFPKCIPTDVEVIELSYNRIRKVSNADLTKFGNLKFLYLSDNLIFNLEDDTFDNLEDLTTLDLSINAITRVPSSVFQLPSLKSLYLSQNMNINIIDAIEGAKPIFSPLTQMDISYTTDENNIPEFPDFGPLPFLVSLNITGNQYSTVYPKNFLGLCRLEILTSNNVTAEFDNDCDCWIINNWLTSKRVKFTPFICHVSKKQCIGQGYTREDMIFYERCQKIYEAMEREYKMYKLSVGLGIMGVIIVLLIILYFLVLRKKICNRNRQNYTRNVENNQLPCENLAALLNNHPKSIPNEYA